VIKPSGLGDSGEEILSEESEKEEELSGWMQKKSPKERT